MDVADGEEVRVRGDDTILQDYGGGLLSLSSTLCGDDALLILHWLPHEDLAVLEDDGAVAEDEIDGAGNGAVSVELTVSVSV